MWRAIKERTGRWSPTISSVCTPYLLTLVPTACQQRIWRVLRVLHDSSRCAADSDRLVACEGTGGERQQFLSVPQGKNFWQLSIWDIGLGKRFASGLPAELGVVTKVLTKHAQNKHIPSGVLVLRSVFWHPGRIDLADERQLGNCRLLLLLSYYKNVKKWTTAETNGASLPPPPPQKKKEKQKLS